jgi:hypothetical protein
MTKLIDAMRVMQGGDGVLQRGAWPCLYLPLRRIQAAHQIAFTRLNLALELIG